ncbi:hypothetical protein cypCar_00004699 [Cyprinus carpio]|nr:hypothetical protein cypCar_00004699 [Cyprinus carpio]
MPDEFEQQSRVKRSEITSSKEGGLNVETLVVADRKMLEKHGRENVTTYVLTVMNMVSSLFKDGTIGNDINIVVVSLLLLEKDPYSTEIIEGFCGMKELSAVEYKYPEQLPGQLYDADIQCKWQFGSKAKLCSLDFVKGDVMVNTNPHLSFGKKTVY